MNASQPSAGGARCEAGHHPAPRTVAFHAAAILLLTGGCLVALAIGGSSPIRVVLSLSFLFFAPGLALAELLEIRDLAQRLAIGTAGSLGVETLVAVSLVYAHAFSLGLAMAILAALTTLAVGLALFRTWRLRTGQGVSYPPRA